MVYIFQIGFICLMAWAAVTDFVRFRIFNVNVLALIGLFCIFALIKYWPLSIEALENIAWHIAASLVCFFFFLIFFILGQMGAGDVKLVAAIALWFGWNPITVQYVLYALIAGGVLTVVLYIWRRFDLPALLQKSRVLKRLHVRSLHTPYGISLGLTAIWFSFQMPIFN